MSRKAPSEREIAADVLMRAEKEGTYPGAVLKEVLDSLDGREEIRKAFIKRLCQGTLEKQIGLDRVLEGYSGRPMASQRPLIRQVLRTGLYQILYMDSVPDAAACDEAVRLVRKRGMGNLSGFVNGVLRHAARDHAAGLVPGLEGEDLSVRYSMPAWIVSLWEDQLGREETEKLLAAMDRIRPLCVRLAPSLTDRERQDLAERLRKRGVTVERGRWVPDCLCLTGAGKVTDLPGFQEGLWTVQDESSMFPALAAGLSGAETVIDVCAAPGGKALHAAALVPEGRVLAFDIGDSKIRRIRENAARMGLSNLEAESRDALVRSRDLEARADVLLCDLPCSGLGILSRKSDIRHRVRKEDLAALSDLQKRILANVSAYLKPGGVLIYSTCTIDRLENEENAAYIEETLGLAPEDLAPFLPEGIPGIEGNRLQLLPHIHGTDGFFLARFRRPLEDDPWISNP